MESPATFLEEVGEEFEILTGGYFLTRTPRPEFRHLDADCAGIRCEIDDERLYVTAPPEYRPETSAAAIASMIASAFDRSDRVHALQWRILGTWRLEDIDHSKLVAPVVGPSNGSGRAGEHS